MKIEEKISNYLNENIDREVKKVLTDWIKIYNKGYKELPDRINGDLSKANSFARQLGKSNPDLYKKIAKEMRRNSKTLSDITDLHPERIEAISGEIEMGVKVSSY